MSSAPASANSARLEEAGASLRSLSIETLTGHKTREFAVDGKVPGFMVRPTSPQGISEVMSIATEHGVSVSPLGGCTRASLGNVPESLDLAIDMAGVDQVLAHNAADLTATVEAGIRVSHLQEVLGKHGQFLAIDPPLPGRATVGGSLAVGWSGPMTWRNWSPRDIVIGMRTVQADGTVTKSGGQVVKNVSGYDMARMHIGALGTLGIIAEASFKLTPLPSRQATVIAMFDSHEECLNTALAACRSSLLPLAIATLHGEASRILPHPRSGEHPSLAVRIGGRANAVRRQIDDLIALCRRSGPLQTEVIEDDADSPTWRRIGDYGWAEDTTPVVGIRASVLPSDIPSVIESLPNMQNSSGLRWGATTQTAQGVIDIHWYGVDDGSPAGHMSAAISTAVQAVRKVGGTAVVTHAPLRIKETLDVWGEPTSALDTMWNLKRQYDPNRLLNPGRFIGGI